MTIQQLRDFLGITDLEFDYNGKFYFVCPFVGYFSAGEANASANEYTTFDSLLNDFIVDGKPFKDILSDIDW